LTNAGQRHDHNKALYAKHRTKMNTSCMEDTYE
jgi:hypothetical protein